MKIPPSGKLGCITFYSLLSTITPPSAPRYSAPPLGFGATKSMHREGCLLGMHQTSNAYTQNKSARGKKPLKGGLETFLGRI